MWTYLDALRGFLSILILAQHIAWVSCNHYEFWWGKAQLCVNVFIVLAGFVAAMTWKSQTTYWSYIWKRLVRLYPVYLVAILLSVLLQTQPAFSWKDFSAHLLLLHGMIPEFWWPHASTSILPTAWFVSLLVQLIFVTPWLVRLSSLKLGALFSTSLVVLLHPLNWRLYVYISEIGANICQKFYLYAGGILLARIFIASGWQKRISAQSSFATWQWIGKISYSLYLVQFPILVALFRLGVTDVVALAISGSIAIIPTSWLVWRVVEAPRQKQRIKFQQLSPIGNYA